MAELKGLKPRVTLEETPFLIPETEQHQRRTGFCHGQGLFAFEKVKSAQASLRK